jgi:hypothetical protein
MTSHGCFVDMLQSTNHILLETATSRIDSINNIHLPPKEFVFTRDRANRVLMNIARRDKRIEVSLFSHITIVRAVSLGVDNTPYKLMLFNTDWRYEMRHYAANFSPEPT